MSAVSILYALEKEPTTVTVGGGGGGVTAHNALTGLTADDHTQYLNNTRGDARYYTKAAADIIFATKAPLVGSVVPVENLPDAVKNVLEYSSLANFPATGLVNTIYIDTATNITYRWNGVTYIAIGSSLTLGESNSTAYRGDRGKAAYDHSQITTGNPHNLDKSDIGLSNVDNTSDLNKPVSTATQTALDLKQSNITVVETATGVTALKNQHIHVTASGQTIILPASPVAGDKVEISVENFIDTVVDRNGNKIMKLAENMTINSQNGTTTFIFISANFGWQII